MNTDAMLSPVKDLIHGRKGMEPTCVEIDHPTLEDVSDDVGGSFPSCLRRFRKEGWQVWEAWKRGRWRWVGRESLFSELGGGRGRSYREGKGG